MQERADDAFLQQLFEGHIEQNRKLIKKNKKSHSSFFFFPIEPAAVLPKVRALYGTCCEFFYFLPGENQNTNTQGKRSQRTKDTLRRRRRKREREKKPARFFSHCLFLRVMWVRELYAPWLKRKKKKSIGRSIQALLLSDSPWSITAPTPPV